MQIVQRAAACEQDRACLRAQHAVQAVVERYRPPVLQSQEDAAECPHCGTRCNAEGLRWDLLEHPLRLQERPAPSPPPCNEHGVAAGAACRREQSAPRVPRVPAVVLDVSESGTKQTRKFATSGDWTLEWSYDCSADYGQKGNVEVVVYQDDGSLDMDDTLVNQLGVTGSDTQYYYDAGTHYLSINSECSWHVTAKG